MPATCGQGLAERAPLAATLAELISALVLNLQLHQSALDSGDPHSKKELDAYAKLERGYRDIATELRSTAEQMSGYRDLPMGKHDTRRLADPTLLKAFDAFVNRERETLTLLQAFLERDETMLRSMRTAKRERVSPTSRRRGSRP